MRLFFYRNFDFLGFTKDFYKRIEMSYIDKRYQLGNYVKDWTGKIVKILELKEGGAKVQYAGDVHIDLPWQDIKPLDITEDLIKQIGFGIIKERTNPYHKEVTASAIINGRYYHMVGILYKDKKLWTFNGMTIRHLHQLQNLLTIVEPSIDHQVQCTPL